MTTIVKFLLLILLSFFSFMGFAHVSEERAIEQVVTDYMESHYKSSQVPMERATIPKITKGQNKNTEDLGITKKIRYPELVSSTNPQSKKRGERPGEPLKILVEILDLDGDMASIKTSTYPYDFYSHMHLAKVDGAWKIVNVLWDTRRAE